MTNRNLKPAETFGPIKTVGDGIALLSKLSYETMVSMRDPAFARPEAGYVIAEKARIR